MIWPDDKFTRFEYARIISARALQISVGAPLLVKTKETEPSLIAREEFKSMKIPMTIKRTMPDGTKKIVDFKKAAKNWISEHN